MNKSRRKRFAIVTTAVVVLIAAALCTKNLYVKNDGGTIGEPYIAFVEMKSGPGEIARGFLSSLLPRSPYSIKYRLYYCDKNGRKRFVRQLIESSTGDYEQIPDSAYICNHAIMYGKLVAATGIVENHWLNLETNDFNESMPVWNEEVLRIIKLEDAEKTLLAVTYDSRNHLAGISRMNIRVWNSESKTWDKPDKTVLNTINATGHSYNVRGYKQWLIFRARTDDNSSYQVLIYDYPQDKILKCIQISIDGYEGKPEIKLESIDPKNSLFFGNKAKTAQATGNPPSVTGGKYIIEEFSRKTDYLNSRIFFAMSYHFCRSPNCTRDTKKNSYLLDTDTLELRQGEIALPVPKAPKGFKILDDQTLPETANGVFYVRARLKSEENPDYQMLNGIYRMKSDGEFEFIDYFDTFSGDLLMINEDGKLWYVRHNNPEWYESELSDFNDLMREVVRYDPDTGIKKVVHRGYLITNMYKTID